MDRICMARGGSCEGTCVGHVIGYIPFFRLIRSFLSGSETDHFFLHNLHGVQDSVDNVEEQERIFRCLRGAEEMRRVAIGY